MAQSQGDRLLRELITFSEGKMNPVQIFSAQELLEITNNYDTKQIIGSGEVSTAYQGIHQGYPVTVKKPGQFGVKDWRKDYVFNEFIVLSQICHKNIVKLLGCCCETEVVTLIYEFCPNRSLHYHIHGVDPRRRLSWKHRLRIATEIADALSYLHTANPTPVIHRDIKSSNIFMGERLTAKIANFGLSVSIPLGKTEVDSSAVGTTMMYSAPEYRTSLQITQKVDVYSYGMVLFELLTGKAPWGIPTMLEGRQTTYIEYFISKIRADSYNLTQVFDVFILEGDNVEQLVACARLCFKCIQVSMEERPTMKEVAQELRRIDRCSSLPNF